MSPEDAELHAALLGRLERELHTLPDKPEESARSALHALWHLAMGRALSADAALEHELPSLNDGAVRQLRMLVDQRLTGTPLAHLTGRQRFMGLEMLSGPQALIPRHESELLARAAVGLLKRLARPDRTLHVLDVCTGSANIAAALANALTPALIHAAGQGPAVLHRLSASGQFPLIEQLPDASGELRVLLARHSVTSSFSLLPKSHRCRARADEPAHQLQARLHAAEHARHGLAHARGAASRVGGGSEGLCHTAARRPAERTRGDLPLPGLAGELHGATAGRIRRRVVAHRLWKIRRASLRSEGS